MRVDVSEIKTFKACKRQWELSSRNKFHLRPLVTPPAFALGTIFHEALAQLYLEVKLDKVMEMVKREMQSDKDAALLAMVPGYAKNVLPGDLDRFKVLDIEHHFEFVPVDSNGEVLFPDVDLTICGSIDMIALDIEENKIYGFEHKTAKTFRDESYLWMDEQPRVYTEALKQYVINYNETKHREWIIACAELRGGDVYPAEPELATLGGIYLNEVKKLLRDFQYNRTLCTYTDEDMEYFMQSFLATALSCKHMVDTNAYAAPNPSYFSCQMCTFKTVCATYMYNRLDKESVVAEFAEEFAERKEDHLDEKLERSAE